MKTLHRAPASPYGTTRASPLRPPRSRQLRRRSRPHLGTCLGGRGYVGPIVPVSGTREFQPASGGTAPGGATSVDTPLTSDERRQPVPAPAFALARSRAAANIADLTAFYRAYANELDRYGRAMLARLRAAS